MNSKKVIQEIKKNTYEIIDFPKKGIIFRDYTPIFLQPKLFKATINLIRKSLKNIEFDVIVAAESRGYLFGVPLALLTKKPFVLIRKPNKLPRPVHSAAYKLEYGKDVLQIHKDDIKPKQRVLLVDDILATGGTISAMHDLIEQSKAIPVASLFLIELSDLNGRSQIKTPVISLIKI